MNALRLLTAIILFSLLNNHAFSQQKLQVNEGDKLSQSNLSRIKTIDGEQRRSAQVVIQSSVQLRYTVMDLPIAQEDISSGVDRYGIYTDTIYFYVNEIDSKRVISIFAKDYPMESVSLNMMPEVTYNFLIIEPEGVVEVVDGETYESLIDKGTKAIQDTQYDLAVVIFDRALKKDSTDVALANISLAQYHQGSMSSQTFYKNAIENANRALQINAKNYLANLVIGKALKQIEDFRFTRYSKDNYIKIAQYLNCAAELEPDKFSDYADLGDVYVKIFDSEIKEIIAKLPRSEKDTYTIMAEMHYYGNILGIGQLIKGYEKQEMSDVVKESLLLAAKNYEKALTIDQTAGVLFALGRTYERLREYPKSLTCYEKAEKLGNTKASSRIQIITDYLKSL